MATVLRAIQTLRLATAYSKLKLIVSIAQMFQRVKMESTVISFSV